MRKYITKQGDTWDLIAYKLWPGLGGEMLMDKLIDLNMQYIEALIFPGGVELKVPEIDLPVIKTLPPWLN